jgi:hypothetical protein
VALKARQTLALDTDVQAFFLVGGSSSSIVLTCREEATNDTTLNIASDNGTCTGLTPAATSANTTAGALTITNGYSTLAQYKAWIAVRGQIGTVVTDASDDDVLAVLIEGASRYIDRETGRKFYIDTTDQTRYYKASEPYCLRIDDLSAAPTSISVDYTKGQRSYTLLTADQYDLTPDNALLNGQPYTHIEINPIFGAYFPKSNRGVKLIGLFGYPSIPFDITEATNSIVQGVNSSRSGQTASGKITVISAGIVIRPEEVPAYAQRIIEHYRYRT